MEESEKHFPDVGDDIYTELGVEPDDVSLPYSLLVFFVSFFIGWCIYFASSVIVVCFGGFFFWLIVFGVLYLLFMFMFVLSAA